MHIGVQARADAAHHGFPAFPRRVHALQRRGIVALRTALSLRRHQAHLLPLALTMLAAVRSGWRARTGHRGCHDPVRFGPTAPPFHLVNRPLNLLAQSRIRRQPLFQIWFSIR